MARSAFRERLKSVDASRLVFVDESSTNVALTPRYGRAPRGERAIGKAPRNWGKNVTLISSIGVEGMGASISIEGSSDTDSSFGLYMREVLAPSLKSGQIVLMDNLSVHTSKWVRDLIEERGCKLWLLPSYSPDLNPIEEAFSKVKGLLRKAKARTRYRRSSKPRHKRSTQSAPMMLWGTSSIVATRCHRTTHYDYRSRDVFLPTLQAADRAHAQAGSLGQILLCEPGCPPMLLE